MKHSKNSNTSYVLFSGIIFIVLVVIMFYTFRSTKLFSLKMSEGFRGGGGGHMGGAGRMGGGGFSGARGSPVFSAAGMRGPSRGGMGTAAIGGAALGGAAAMRGGMRGGSFRGGTPQQQRNFPGGNPTRQHGNWNKDRRNYNRWGWNNNYWWGAPFLGGAYYLNNYLDNDYGNWYPGYSYYPDWGYEEPNVTNVYNIYNDKKQTSEEESKKSGW